MVYQAPDIRIQTIHEAEERISKARVRRMVMRQAYVEKAQVKLDKQKASEAARYQRRIEMLDKALDNLSDQINKAVKRLEDVKETHAVLVNIETHEL